VTACRGRNDVNVLRRRVVPVNMNPTDDWFANSRRARTTE
jgi:hypothetical protein